MPTKNDALCYHALDDWSKVVGPYVECSLKDHLFYFDPEAPWLFEFDEFEAQLRPLSLQEIAELSIDPFAPIGDGIPMLKPEAFLWLLPVLLRFATCSEEPIYSCGVINHLLQDVMPMPIWRQIKQEVSRETLDCMHEYAKHCCRLGWEGTTERRVQKRLAACAEAFG